MSKWKFTMMLITLPLWVIPVGVYAVYKIWEDEFSE